MVLLIVLVDEKEYDSEKCESCLGRFSKPTEFAVGEMISGAGNLVLAFTLSIYILVAIYSVVFAYRRLERPGVSREARNMFLKKHIYYVFVFIIIWTINLSSNYFTLFNPSTSSTPTAFEIVQKLLSFGSTSGGSDNNGDDAITEVNGKVLYYMSAIMTFSTGIFLTAVRFVEPLFRYLLWSGVYQFYGELYQANDTMSEEERQV